MGIDVKTEQEKVQQELEMLNQELALTDQQITNWQNKRSIFQLELNKKQGQLELLNRMNGKKEKG